MDDSLASVDSVNEAVNLTEGTRLLLDKDDLKLHKFVSNSPEVLTRVNQNNSNEVIGSTHIGSETNYAGI